MSSNPDSTLPSRRLPAIVLVAPSPGLLATIEGIARQLDDVPRVKTASLKDAATVVAEWRPFAIVVSPDVLAFDPREFEALAQDVGAEVVACETDTGSRDVITALLPALQAALARWTGSSFANR